jgi:hypothetical protein
MRTILKKTGPATLVLLSVQPPAKLPTKKQLRLGFGSDPLAIYKRPGWFDREIDRMAMVHASQGSMVWANYEAVQRTTHVLVFPHGPCNKVQSMLMFGETIICGFTVDGKALDQLAALLSAKDSALTIENTMSNVTYSLKRAKELAERIGAQDETVDAALERHLASIDPDYGAAVSAHCLVLERKLLDLYRWRDSRE